MKFLPAISLGLSVLILGLSQTSARGFTLDAFSDVDVEPFQEAFDNTLGDGGDSVTDGQTTSLSDVIGGTRTIEVEKLTNSRSSKSVAGDVDTDTNLFSYSSSTATQGSFSLIWDGNFSPDESDLTDDGGTQQNFFQVNIESNDLGVTLEFDISDGTNNSTYQQSIPAMTTGPLYFPYASFSNPSVLESAQSITLRSISAPAALDLQFSLFAKAEVPFEFSPTLGIIVGGSFIGFNALKKRLNKQ